MNTLDINTLFNDFNKAPTIQITSEELAAGQFQKFVIKHKELLDDNPLGISSKKNSYHEGVGKKIVLNVPK